MDVKEFDELINALPKVKIDKPISSMNSINVDDLRNAVERFKKIPTYQDLLKENQELKEQQKEFIADLKSMLKNEKDNFSVARVKDVLEKYKEIVGDKQ